MSLKLRIAILGICLSAPMLACGQSVPAQAPPPQVPATTEVGEIVKRAERGDVESQNLAGLAYRSDSGVAQDDAKAAQWFKRAAGKGYAPAEFNLATMYWEGRGVRRDLPEAVHRLRKAAAKGYAPAESALGSMYRNGGVLKQDFGKAVLWYTKAAEHGDAEGQYQLGLMYETGQGVQADCAQALKWLTQAAAQNLPAAQFRAGRMYDTGACASRNDKEAARLYQAAAAQGNHEAEARLGWFYLMGYGVGQSDTLAVQWFTRAAEAGEPTGQFMLGQMYRDGRAVNKNTVAAYKWFKLAVASGSKIDGTESLKSGMTPQEIAAAEAQVRAWKSDSTADDNARAAAQTHDPTPQKAAVSPALTASLPGFDQYGGPSSRPCTNKTGHWITVKQGARWWFCTPAGHVYFWQSVGGIMIDSGSQGTDPKKGQSYNLYEAVVKKYGDATFTWGAAQNARMRAWGFNGIGQMSSHYLQPTATGFPANLSKDGKQPVKLPGFDTFMVSNYAGVNLWGYGTTPLKNLTKGFSGNNHNWYGASLMDYLDPGYQTWVTNYLAADGGVQGLNHSAYGIGLFLDDTDWSWGFGAGPDFSTYPTGHTSSAVGYSVITTSPVQRFQPSPAYAGIAALYSDGKVHAKTAMTSPPTTCSIATPCSLRDYLAKRYGSIAALNRAWGSNYTTFDSSGAAYTGQVVATGDGSTRRFAFTLPHTPVSPYSVAVSVGNNQVAGDCPWYNGNGCNVSTSGKGSLAGPNTAWSHGYVYRGSYVMDSYGSLQEAITGNTDNGPTPPKWNKVQGGTTSDGSVVWRNLGPAVKVSPQPWLSTIEANANVSGYPAASWWAVTAYHYADGTSGTVSRKVGENYAMNHQPWVTNPAYKDAGTDPNATGWDVYVSCRLTRSTVGVFGCVGMNDPEPEPTLQASNIPLRANWTIPRTGLLKGSATPPASSYIDYSSGGTSILFASAPARGMQIKLDYVANGWPFGTGLMDEDGRSPWIGTNDVCLTAHAVCGQGKEFRAPNAKSTAGADLESWQAQFSASYFKMSRAAVNASTPNLLYFGTDTLGTWGVPPAREILEGAAPYVDGIFINFRFDLPTSSAQFSYLTRYAGDIPLMNFMTLEARPDSALYRYREPDDLPTQAARGQTYYNNLKSMLTTPSYHRTYPWVGINWWGLYDFWNEKNNWGLISLSDNVYDGVEAIPGTHSCTAPLQTYSCGGEEKAYGDVIKEVKAANGLWLLAGQE